MAGLIQRDVEYALDDTVMRGLLVAPEGAFALPTVLLFHDAFGLGDDMIAIARQLAEHGYTVFAADVWGNRTTPTDSPRSAAHRLDGRQPPRVARPHRRGPRHRGRPARGRRRQPRAPRLLLRRLLRTRIRPHRRPRAGLIAIHPGLDIIESTGRPPTPASTRSSRSAPPIRWRPPSSALQLEQALNGADIDWELDLYSHTAHAFTSRKAQSSPRPDVFAYHPRNAERAWNATTRFLGELFPSLRRIAGSDHRETEDIMHDIAIIGAGPGGLVTALRLHQQGIRPTIYEAAPELRPLGVGVDIKVYGVKEIEELGLLEEFRAMSVDAVDSIFFNHYGQEIYAEKCGVHMGYLHEQRFVHRGSLQMLFYRTVLERLGEDAVKLGHRAVSYWQDDEA